MANNVAGEISMDLNVNTDKAEKSLDSYAAKLQALMTRLSKVQDTTKNSKLRGELEKIAQQMLVAGRATTGLGLLSEMRSYLPKGTKLTSAQEYFLKGSLSSAQAENQKRKQAESAAARIAVTARREAIRAEEQEQKEKQKKEQDIRQIEDLQNRFNILQRYKGLYGVTDKYDTNIRKLSKDVKSIDKSTKGEYKELKQLGKNVDKAIPERARDKGSTLAGLPLGRFLTAAGIAGLVAKLGKFLWNSGKRGLTEGYDILSEQAKYGPDRAIGLTKMMSTLFKIDKNTAASVDRYARDFKQRLMWGEVGEREFIGLGRMGEAGRMIMSGRAEEDPKTFLRTLQQWMLNTDSATVRSTLRQMNWSEDLMKLKLNPYDEEEFNALVDQFDELTDKEAKAAADALAFQNDMRTISKQIDANVAELAGSIVKDPVAALRILRNIGRSDEEIEAAYPGLIKKAEEQAAKKTRLQKVIKGEENPKTPEEVVWSIFTKDIDAINKLKEKEKGILKNIVSKTNETQTEKTIVKSEAPQANETQTEKPVVKSEAPVAEYTAPKTYNGSADDLAPKQPTSAFVYYPRNAPLSNNTETKNISYENNITVPVTVNGNGTSEEIGRTIGKAASEVMQTSMAQILSKTGDIA